MVWRQARSVKCGTGRCNYNMHKSEIFAGFTGSWNVIIEKEEIKRGRLELVDP